MSDGQTVQGNTESVADSGVYSDAASDTAPAEVTPPVEAATESAIDPAVERAVETAVKQAETPAEPEYNFTMPEGVEMDQAAIEQFIPIAKELGLTPEAAQKIVDIQANQVVAARKAHETAVNTARDAWVKEISSDPELGGEKLQETLYIANQGLESLGDIGLAKLLSETGFGDHPIFIRAFHKIGLMHGDDKAVFGGPTSQHGIGDMYNNSPDLK